MESKLPSLGPVQRALTNPSLLDPVENRKSGLSLNHIIGCPLDCAYCVRHLFGNFQMKVPHALLTDEEAVARLTTHPYFMRDLTPLQLLNRATDPLLPTVKEHTFRVLKLLADMKLRNHVLIITRYALDAIDAARLNDFAPLRVTLLVTYSGIEDDRIEPFGSKVAAETLRTAFEHAQSFRTILYWRPLVSGLNDSEAHIERAAALGQTSHATVFTGLFYRDTIREYYRANRIPEPYAEVARRKVLPSDLEHRVISKFQALGGGPLFRKTSCGVAFAHSAADYNGHYGIREVCDICPTVQVERCKMAFRRPSAESVAQLAAKVGAPGGYTIDDRAVVFESLDEQRRYHIQHTLGFQIHDARNPHRYRRHGRAEIGWEGQDENDD